MELDEHIYSNMSSSSKSQSQDNRAGSDKRVGKCLIITISVLFFFSLLANAVMVYLYCKIKLAPYPPWSQMKCTSGQLIEGQERDRLYLFSQERLSWSSSREHCKELGGDLAIVNSQEENDFLVRMVNTVGNSSLYWIGLTDAETEGVWLWVDQTPLLKNLTWWAYTPDDWKAHNPLGEDCAVYYNNKWADVSCLYQAKRICEIPCTHDSY